MNQTTKIEDKIMTRTITIWRSDFEIFPRLMDNILNAFHWHELKKTQDAHNFFIVEGSEKVINKLYK